MTRVCFEFMEVSIMLDVAALPLDLNAENFGTGSTHTRYGRRPSAVRQGPGPAIHFSGDSVSTKFQFESIKSGTPSVRGKHRLA